MTKFAPGEFVYVAKFAEAIYVLHAFVKKTRQTAKRDIILAGTRYRALLNQRSEMKARVKMTKGSGNVFRDIGFPEEEAQNLLLRSDLMMKIDEFVAKKGLTQKQAAKILGVTQPRVNLLLKGKIQYFSLDALVNMVSRAGMRVKLSVSKPLSKKAA